MIWIFNDLSWTLVLVFSLASIVSIGYFKFGNSFTDSAQLLDYLNSFAFVKRLNAKLNENARWAVGQSELNSVCTTSNKYATFKMTSVERKQSFIRRSLAERCKKQQQHHHQTDQHHESFIYSSIFSFTRTLINRAPKSMTNVTAAAAAKTITQPDELADSNTSFQFSKASNDQLTKAKLPLHNTMSTMSNLNEHLPRTSMCKSVSLQIKDEMKAIPNRLLHQSSSSGSSNSSTPAYLFSMAEKGRIGANARKHKALVNNKVHQEPAYTELVTQIQGHEDAINREYLLHQLNPSQYHSMHYYRRLERQNCLTNETRKRSSSKKKMITKQSTVQSNSSNANDEHFSSSSSNLSCSECGSLDTEEELTIPFMRKSGHYQPNLTLRSKQPLRLSSSLEKNNLNNTINLTKQCSSDSNEAMVGLLNENLIKRQLSNGTYLKLKSDRLSDKLSEKRKRILGRRLTAQNSFSAGSSFNNSSNNSSFDHDDMLVQFTSHQANSFSSTDHHHHFHYNHYENNSIHSNDTSSSSNSSCGHRHAERNKSNLNEFHSLCDSNQLNQTDLIEQDEYCVSANNAIQVTHAYDPTTRKLKIRIVKADYVPTKLNQDCDRCYIKLILLPNKKFKTTVKPCGSGAVEFDELFTFNRISPENVMSLSVKYLLYLVNNESKHRNIGEACIRFENRKPMQQEDSMTVYLNPLNPTSLVSPTGLKSNYNVISPSNGKPNTANNESLSDVSSICRSDSAESHHSIQLNLPELLLGLSYNATTGRLQVSIVRGSQFKAKSNKPPDTYVKCTLFSSTGREIGRNKTSVKRAQPNPVYKQTFAFQIPVFQLPDVSLMISVYNKKSMNRKEMIGWFSLGCSSSGEEENSHWMEMRDSKGEQVGRQQKKKKKCYRSS